MTPRRPAVIWQSSPPADCPFEPSREITGIAFTGRHKEYTRADTWYPSWAADGNLYSPWTDGWVDEMRCSSFGGATAATGQAVILGDDPRKLDVIPIGTQPAPATPYGGRYPCGSLVHHGVWYYGTYCLMNLRGSLEGVIAGKTGLINWGVLGPLVGFRSSQDGGKTWTETRHTPEQPLFGEPEAPGGLLKMGAPHFVDFGRNMQHAPDGRAYLVGQGAAAGAESPREAQLGWITADQAYLARVVPGLETIDDAGAYEFFAGHDAQGEPMWTRSLGASRPLIEWPNHCGCVTITYNPGLQKYLMFVTDGRTTMTTFNTFVLESDRVTGPWKLVTYMERFGEQGYFVNLPSKFISADGRAGWLCYSANFTNGWGTCWKPRPSGGRYGMCLQEVTFL